MKSNFSALIQLNPSPSRADMARTPDSGARQLTMPRRLLALFEAISAAGSRNIWLRLHRLDRGQVDDKHGADW